MLLFVAIGIAFQIPAVQTFMAQKATVFLASHLKTKVSISRFTTDWRNSIVLKDIYIEDQNRDTLLYAGRLGLDLHILVTTRNRLKIRSVKIENGTLQMHSNKNDSSYNFSFIADAFGGSSGNGKDEPFSLQLGHVTLQKIRVRLSDPVTGNAGMVSIGKLTVNAKTFDTRTKTYDLGRIKLQNSTVLYRKTREPDSASQESKQRFTFKEIELENLKVDMQDEPLGRRLEVNLGKALLQADNIALQEARADLSKFRLENTAIQIYRFPLPAPDTTAVKPETMKQEAQATGEKKSWAVWLQKTEWKNVSFTYHNQTVPKIPKGLDFNHFRFQDINLKLNNLYYSQGRVSGIMENFQLQEKSGLRIRSLKGNVKAGADFVELQKLELRTNHSVIRDALSIQLATARKQKFLPGANTTFQARLRNVQFSPRDLLYLAPDLAAKPFYRKLGNRTLLLNGRVYGQVRNMHFRDFSLKGWTNTNMLFSGNIQDLQLEKSRKVDLNIRKLTSGRKDLDVIMANGKAGPKFRFPERISLSGRLQSKLNRISFQNLNVTGSNGLVLQATGNFSGPPGNRSMYLQARNLVVTRQALLNMLPAGAVTPEVQIPERVQFAGTFQGKPLQQFALKGNFNTTFGNVFADIKVEPVQRFSGHISLDKFETGKLLKQEKLLGQATGKADFNGKGFKVKTMQLHYDAHVKKIVFKGDTYHNIRLEGDLNQKIYQLNGNLANAALQGLGHKLQKLKPKNLDLKKVNPTRLIPKKVEPKKLVPKFMRKKKKKEETEKQE